MPQARKSNENQTRQSSPAAGSGHSMFAVTMFVLLGTAALLGFRLFGPEEKPIIRIAEPTSGQTVPAPAPEPAVSEPSIEPTGYLVGVVAGHKAVRDVAVIGIPDPKWGEAIKAVVSLALGQSTTEEELIAFCKDNIASYKKPKSVDFVEELPKNNYGKILKRELRARYWEGKERKV